MFFPIGQSSHKIQHYKNYLNESNILGLVHLLSTLVFVKGHAPNNNTYYYPDYQRQLCKYLTS